MNYENGKIYKIESALGDKVYIGSTTKQYLSQRMENHRSKYKNKDSQKGKCTSFKLFDEYGVDNCNILLIEKFSCSSKDELVAREAFYIKQFNTTCVNIVIPQRTKSEYYDDNKEKMNSISREYYANHNEEREVYLEQTKECRNA